MASRRLARQALASAFEVRAAARAQAPVRAFSSATPSRQQQQPDAGPSGNSEGSSSSSSNTSEGAKRKKKKDDAEEGDAADALPYGRTPFQAFTDVFREEIRKSRDWQDSVKQLQGEAGRVADSEMMRRSKEMYERARLMASIKENPRLREVADEMRRQGIKVNDVVSTALRTMDDNPFLRHSRQALSKGARAVGDAAMTASEPLRNTEAYKAIAQEISEALDEAGSSVRYGGYLEREARMRRREARLRKIGRSSEGLKRPERTEENPEAGEAVVLHATANKEAKSSGGVLPASVQRFLANANASYQESENPFVTPLRTVTNAIGGFFAETETAKVMTYMKELDPAFTQEGFVQELREYIVPELVDSLITLDWRTLQLWLSESTLQVNKMLMDKYAKPGLIPESRVLDIRNVDIHQTRILEPDDRKVFVVRWETQEVIACRDVKTGEIAVGSEDRIITSIYVAIFERLPEGLDDPITGGWKAIDMIRRES